MVSRYRQLDLSRQQQYGLALGQFILAFALRNSLLPVGGGYSYLTFYPAMMLCFAICGTAPGALFAGLSAVAGYYYFSPAHLANGRVDEVALVTFLISASIIALVSRKLAGQINSLHEFVHNSPTAIISLDPSNAKIMSANPVALALLGYSETELLTKTIVDISCPEDREASRQRIASLFKGEMDHLQLQKRYLRKDGTTFWAEINTASVKTADGKVRSVIGNIKDITVRKLLDDALKASEKRYQSLLEDQTELICRFKADGTILYVNSAYGRFFGIAQADATGTQWQPVMFDQDLPYVQAQLATLTPQQSVVTLEKRVFAAHHEIRWVQFVNRAFFDENAHLLEIQAVGRDISERKETELLLRQENEKNLALLRNASDGIHILDRHGYILEASDSFCNMLGYERNQIIGMHVSQWDTGFANADALMTMLLKQFENPDRSQFETRHRRRDGTVFDVEVSGNALVYAGELVLFNSSRDIGERKLLNETLTKTHAEIEDLYDQAPCGYHSIGADGTIMRINATELVWLGCSKSEIIGKRKITDFFTPEGKALFHESFPTFMKNGFIRDLEFEIVVPGLPRRIISLSATAILDTDGKFLKSRSVMFDITQTKAIQNALRASEERFRTMANSAPVLIWISGLDSACNWFNKVWLDFTGRSLEQEVGNGWLEGVHPDDLQPCLDIYAGHFDRREEFRMEYRLRRHDGAYRWIDDHGVPQLDSQGNFSGYIGSCIDITESKELSLQLQQTLQVLEGQTARLETILKHASDGIHILDMQGNILQFSESFARMIGYSYEETAALNVTAWEAQITQDQIGTMLANLLHTPATFETRHRRKDGSIYDVEIHATLIQLDGVSCIYASARDISQRKQQEQQLWQLSIEQQAMLDNELIGIIKVKDRHILWKNKAVDKVFGYENDALVGASTQIFYPDILAYQALGDAAYPVLHKHCAYRTQLEMLRKNGEKIWVDLSGVLLSEERHESMWMLSDITPIKQHEAEITRIAYHDILTGLPNRLLVADRLTQALAQAVRSKRMLAVCYLDLDGFKPVNDNHGHEAGDRLLKEIARRMQASVRANDTVGRLGGDEFVMLLTGLESVEEFQVVVGRVANQINQPFLLSESLQVSVSASIGITLFPADSNDPDILLRHADQAMYQAKQSGRNRVCLFTADMQ